MKTQWFYPRKLVTGWTFLLLLLSITTACAGRTVQDRRRQAVDPASPIYIKIAETDKTLGIDAVTLIYTEAISDGEAHQVRDFFMRYGGFRHQTLPFHLHKDDNTYQLRVFAGDEMPPKSEFLALMQALADALSVEAFGGAAVEVHLLRPNLERLWAVRSRRVVE